MGTMKALQREIVLLAPIFLFSFEFNFEEPPKPNQKELM